MPVAATLVLFAAATAVSLVVSALLVTRLERIGVRLGLSEAALGVLAALAANAPEVTSAITAMARHERQIGAGVVLGSNAFNVAALLGVGALVARRIRLHRKVVVFAGVVGLWEALVALGAAGAVVTPGAALALGIVVFAPYVALCAAPGWATRTLPPAPAAWITSAVAEEEDELLPAVHARRARGVDYPVAAGALAVVVGASVVMERSASSVGVHFHLSRAVVGAVMLAAVTSLPNAVAAVYLARRGRGSAVLSEALNSNNLNVVVGLLVPGSVLGLGQVAGPTVLTAAFAIALTAAALGLAYGDRGLRRVHGAGIVAGYLVLVVLLAAGV